MKNAAPVMDAAFVISIKTRHGPNQTSTVLPAHAANSDASWFFCSVMVFSVKTSAGLVY